MASHAEGCRARRDRDFVTHDRHVDPRIAYALALLQDYLGGHEAAQSVGAPQDIEAAGWLQSNTDILTPWYPNAAAIGTTAMAMEPRAGTAAWDAYFAGMPIALGSGLAAEPFAEPPAAPAASEAYELVIDTLYDFLHALGRGDVAAAMDHVARDYHGMDGDREITREGLRHQLEALVDARRERGLQVSLARIPEPIAHPLGVLVQLTVHVDSTGIGGTPESLLLHRIAVFCETAAERWQLVSLGIVDPPA